MSDETNYEAAARFAIVAARAGLTPNPAVGAAQAYATLALVDAVRELTEAVKANRPPRTVSGLPQR